MNRRRTARRGRNWGLPNTLSLIEISFYALLAQLSGAAGTALQTLRIPKIVVESAQKQDFPQGVIRVAVDRSGALEASGRATDLEGLRRRFRVAASSTLVVIEADPDARIQSLAEIVSAASEAKLPTPFLDVKTRGDAPSSGRTRP